MVLCSRETYIFVYVELNFLEDNLCVHLIDQKINVHLIDQIINVHLIDQKKKKKCRHCSLAESDEHNAAERLLFKYLSVASYWSLYWIEWD